MKRICTSIVALCFAVILLNNCTVFKKKIDKPVVVALSDTTFVALIRSTAYNAKYTTTITPQEVIGYFLKGFKSEAKITPNVRLQFNENGADYILKFKNLEVLETSTTQVISDPKSKYNGQQVVLNTVEVKADMSIIDVKEPSKKLMSCSNSKQRQESETDNRNIDDLISGTNKDRTQYRTKLLNDHIALTLSEDVGRRIWVPITRRVAKTLK